MSYMKPQDVRLICLLIANNEYRNAHQSKLAQELKFSVSTINASIKRLKDVGLIVQTDTIKYLPNIPACKEFLKVSTPYVYYGHKDILELAFNAKFDD
jgi:biotin operon repressor